jgi:CheY-like chemotaxis protein
MTAQPPQAMPQSTTEPFPVLPKPLSQRQLLDAVAGTLRSAGEQPRIRRGSEPGANVHPATILVVEDHPAARSALAEALSETGFRVLPASTVAAAGRIAIAERPQLLLSDVQLADGNGIALAEELRTADPALRVLYVTGRDVQAPDLRAALQAPRTAALGKPAALAEILFAVRGLLTAEGPDDPRPPERK